MYAVTARSSSALRAVAAAATASRSLDSSDASSAGEPGDDRALLGDASLGAVQRRGGRADGLGRPGDQLGTAPPPTADRSCSARSGCRRRRPGRGRPGTAPAGRPPAPAGSSGRTARWSSRGRARSSRRRDRSRDAWWSWRASWWWSSPSGPTIGAGPGSTWAPHAGATTPPRTCVTIRSVRRSVSVRGSMHVRDGAAPDRRGPRHVVAHGIGSTPTLQHRPGAGGSAQNASSPSSPANQRSTRATTAPQSTTRTHDSAIA